MTEPSATTDTHHGLEARPLVAAGLLALPVGILSLLVIWAVHKGMHVLWHDIPDELGWSEPAWWYVLLVPTLGGLLTMLSLRTVPEEVRPHGEGLSASGIPVRALPGLLGAALFGLSMGAVLGPEAPLMALGIALGAVAARLARVDSPGIGFAITLSGAFAALSTVFGQPMAALILLFEIIAASGKIPSKQLVPTLMPGFLAAGVSALLFTGVERWDGITLPALSLPQLPDYPTIQWADVLWSVPVAVAASAMVRFVHVIRGAVDGQAARLGSALLPLAGLAIGVVALVSMEWFDTGVDVVLFSGQSSLPEVVAIGSAGTLVAIAFAKAIGYGISLGAGFEGGPVFPAIAIGVMLGTAASIALPGADMMPMVAVAVAAASTTVQRLPIFGTIMAIEIVGLRSTEVIPLIIVAALVGWGMSRRLEPATH